MNLNVNTAGAMPVQNPLKSAFGKMLSSSADARATVAGMIIVAGAAANAALPTGIDTQLAAVQADGLAMADLVWPVVITLFGALVLFKLFKRFGSQI
ncbi:MAG: hypothetical protein JXR18_14120 [Neptuniibacter sp.]